MVSQSVDEVFRHVDDISKFGVSFTSESEAGRMIRIGSSKEDVQSVIELCLLTCRDVVSSGEDQKGSWRSGLFEQER